MSHVDNMAGFRLLLESGASAIFEYNTSKVVNIRSKSIGLLNRLVQLAVVGYIIGWVMIYKAGYQQVDRGIAGTTTKVKGIAYTPLESARIGKKVWDAQDVVVPAEENNAFFVTTNVIVTNDQTQDECPESSSVTGAKCTSNSDCPEGEINLLGHGVYTGTCNTTTSTCMVTAWCPIEDDEPVTTYAVLNGTQEFTVLMKNHVFFPFYNKTRSNIIESTNASYLQGCTYDSDTNPFCPVFKLGYIVSKALEHRDSDTTYEQIAYKGGVISIQINWDCNFDHDPKECKPTYRFDRLDKGEDSKISKGYNFRYSNVYFVDGIETRQLIKAYGILFIIAVNSKAAAFNIIPTLQNIGSGLALLGVATVLCDFFVLYVHTKKIFFKRHKYEDVKTSDAFEVHRRDADDEDDQATLSSNWG